MDVAGNEAEGSLRRCFSVAFWRRGSCSLSGPSLRTIFQSAGLTAKPAQKEVEKEPDSPQIEVFFDSTEGGVLSPTVVAKPRNHQPGPRSPREDSGHPMMPWEPFKGELPVTDKFPDVLQTVDKVPDH